MISTQEKILRALEILKEATKEFTPTLTTSLIKDFGRDPFVILISCLLSLRARDTATYPVSCKLFKRARTPEELLAIPLEELEAILFPLGFYRKKAQTVHSACRELIKRFESRVPSTEAELLSIKGVGRKTANLVMAAAFEVPSICVDTHVHRIANRLGWINTKNPDETERALKELVPKEHWISLNTYLVLWGQNVCTPLSPKCSQCNLSSQCPKIGVGKRR